MFDVVWCLPIEMAIKMSHIWVLWIFAEAAAAQAAFNSSTRLKGWECSKLAMECLFLRLILLKDESMSWRLWGDIFSCHFDGKRYSPTNGYLRLAMIVQNSTEVNNLELPCAAITFATYQSPTENWIWKLKSVEISWNQLKSVCSILSVWFFVHRNEDDRCQETNLQTFQGQENTTTAWPGRKSKRVVFGRWKVSNPSVTLVVTLLEFPWIWNKHLPTSIIFQKLVFKESTAGFMSFVLWSSGYVNSLLWKIHPFFMGKSFLPGQLAMCLCIFKATSGCPPLRSDQRWILPSFPSGFSIGKMDQYLWK